MIPPSEPQADSTQSGIVGLLLAGGQGSRFAAAGGGDKLLTSWQGTPIAVHSARLLTGACDQVFAVLPPGKPALSAALAREGCTLLEHEAVREGMGASISSALRAILARARPRAVVVMLADMPAIRVDTLKALLRAWLARSEAACAVLRYRGRRGHPVVFGSSAFDGLLALSGDRGAARLIDSLTPIFLDVDDPGILNDIDTPADLMQLEEHPHGTKSDE